MNGHQIWDGITRVSTLTSLLASIVLTTVLITSRVPAGSAPEREWVLPALFTGQGAVTIGCQLWDAPSVTAYGSQNPNTGFAAGGFSTERFMAMVDGPHGTTVLGGEACGVSVDWRRFPAGERPND